MSWLAQSHSWTKLGLSALNALRHHPTYPLRVYTTLLVLWTPAISSYVYQCYHWRKVKLYSVRPFAKWITDVPTQAHNCYYHHKFHIFCFIEPFDVRLVDGPSPKEGRLEILHNNTWGSVCNQGWRHSRNAPVVCKQLGRTIFFTLVDHSYIVLIIGDLNGLGHLPEFADQISDLWWSIQYVNGLYLPFLRWMDGTWYATRRVYTGKLYHSGK